MLTVKINNRVKLRKNGLRGIDIICFPRRHEKVEIPLSKDEMEVLYRCLKLIFRK